MAAIGTPGADTPLANMSPQPPRDDEQDFLDDFVLEDGPELAQASEGDGLDDLFAVPEGIGLTEPVAQPGEAPAHCDPEDLLFQDHTGLVQASEQFAEPVGFVEDADAVWQGEGLELDPPTNAAPTADSGDPIDFAIETDAEPEWEIDAEQELELVGADEPTNATHGDAAADGPGASGDVFPAGEFTAEELLQQMAASDPFDGDAELPAEAAEELLAAEAPTTAEEIDEQALVLMEDGAETWAVAAQADELDAEFDAALVPAGAEQVDLELEEDTEAQPIEPGWEPLPFANMDALAEVHEVGVPESELLELAPTGYEEPLDEAATETDPAPVLAGPMAWRAQASLSAGVDEDLYQEHATEELAVVGGAQARRRPRRTAAWVAAAGLCIAGVAAAYGFLPEWTGVVAQPEPTVVGQVPRPALQVAVAPPPLPEPKTAMVVRVAQAEPVPPPPEPVASQPVLAAAEQAGTQPPQQGNLSKPNPPTVESVAVTAPEPKPAGDAPQAAIDVVGPTVAAPSAPLAVANPPAERSPESIPEAQPTASWPVAKAAAEVRRGSANGGRIRIGAGDALITDEPLVPTASQPVDGVLPGNRAFAQLQNGNYFIGNIKQIDASQVTLRLGRGEITLVRTELVKLLPLGTDDYEALQKVNSGSVRLTNRNRLVGSIISDIADDYVVLEFRSNRVMLPKAAVGEVVQGDGDASLRLATTREEDDWLRRLVERQLGTGLPAAPPAGSAR